MAKFDEELDPLVPDTDGDGYWDGWIGVYGVGRTDNVVLYRHHLQTGPVLEQTDSGRPIHGVSGKKAVPEQALVHETNDGDIGANIDGDSAMEHSRVHIGELHWGTNPDNQSQQPDLTVNVQADYYEGVDYGALRSNEWKEAVEKNYALYGIDVNIEMNEPFDDADVSRKRVDLSVAGLDIPNRYRESMTDEFRVLLEERVSPAKDIYLLVGPIADEDPRRGAEAFPYRNVAVIYVPGFRYQYIKNTNIPVSETKFTSEVAMMGSWTTLHELGHNLCIGFADDTSFKGERTCDQNKETYTGSPQDPTREIIASSRFRSIMTADVGNETFLGPMGGNYQIFTIEELSTVKMP